MVEFTNSLDETLFTSCIQYLILSFLASIAIKLKQSKALNLIGDTLDLSTHQVLPEGLRLFINVYTAGATLYLALSEPICFILYMSSAMSKPINKLCSTITTIRDTITLRTSEVHV